MNRFLCAWAAALLLWALPAQGQWVDPSRNWRTFDTANFSLHFAEEHRPQAHVVAGVAETVYARVTRWLNWRPEARTHLVVLDSADAANGWASPLPFNWTAIFLSPPDEGELLQNREWLDLVLTHELVHIVHLDLARGSPMALRRIFGRAPPWWLIFPNTLPNVWGPNWVKEGLAVYAESDAGKGWGRLEQSTFEGMMRAEVARGPISLREIHADGRGFPHNRDYLYGGYFFLFLNERYGPRAISSFVENYSDDFIPFRVHTNPVVATRKTMDVLWVEYQDWLRERFAAKPGEAEKGADAAGEIVARAFSLTSPALTPGGGRWYVQSDGYTRPRLLRQAKGGEAEDVRAVERDARLAVSGRDELVVAQPEICNDYNYYYDLYRVGPDDGWERVTTCGRLRFAAPLDDGRIAALRVEKGEGEVVIVDGKGAVERTLYRAAPGESVTGLAAWGQTVALTSLRDGRWSLIEIVEGKASVRVTDPAIKHSPRYGATGDEIYFVANYDNTYNVWSWRRGERMLSRWTRATTGVREISAPVAGEMLLTTIEADGDVLRAYRLPESALERREAAAPAAEAPAPVVADDPQRSPERPYSPWSALLPRSWFPTFYIADGAVAVGVTTFGQDALGLHQYSVSPMYEFTQNKMLGSLIYEYNERHRLLLDRRMSVKASTENNDDEQEVQKYTITDSVQWVSTLRSLSLNTRYYLGLGGALDREKFHDVNAGTTSLSDERVLGLVAGVDTRRIQWLSEGPSQGQQLRLWAETSNGLNGTYSGNVYRGDLRVYLPVRKTVVALRWNEVYGQADAEPIELGGSETNESLALPVLNRREFPLRGYSSGEPVLTGHRSRLGTFEWRVPLSDVDRHFMVPPVGMNRVSMSLFFDIGAAWDSGESPDYHRGVGIELLSDLRFGYLFGLQLRAGVAWGLDGPGETKGYLRIGRSF